MQQITYESDVTMMRLFRHNAARGWKVITFLPHMVTYEVSNNEDRDLLISVCGDALESEATKMMIFIRVNTNNKITRILPANGEYAMNASPLVTVSQAINISPAMHEAYGQILAHSDGAGLVRLSDNLQLALNEHSDGTLVNGATIDDAVQWQREQYWHQEDLDIFLRDTRQQLEPNNVNSWITRTYRVYDPKAHNGPTVGSQNCDREITSKYRLIFNGGDSNDLRNYFHLGMNLDIKTISA